MNMLKNEPARGLFIAPTLRTNSYPLTIHITRNRVCKKTNNQCPQMWTLMDDERKAYAQSFTMRSINMIRSWRILKPDMTLFGMPGFMG